MCIQYTNIHAAYRQKFFLSSYLDLWLNEIHFILSSSRMHLFMKILFSLFINMWKFSVHSTIFDVGLYMSWKGLIFNTWTCHQHTLPLILVLLVSFWKNVYKKKTKKTLFMCYLALLLVYVNRMKNSCSFLCVCLLVYSENF